MSKLSSENVNMMSSFAMMKTKEVILKSIITRWDIRHQRIVYYFLLLTFQKLNLFWQGGIISPTPHDCIHTAHTFHLTVFSFRVISLNLSLSPVIHKAVELFNSQLGPSSISPILSLLSLAHHREGEVGFWLSLAHHGEREVDFWLSLAHNGDNQKHTSPSPWWARDNQKPTSPSPWWVRDNQKPTSPSPWWARDNSKTYFPFPVVSKGQSKTYIPLPVVSKGQSKTYFPLPLVSKGQSKTYFSFPTVSKGQLKNLLPLPPGE
jgi:hypothetical protein